MLHTRMNEQTLLLQTRSVLSASLFSNENQGKQSVNTIYVPAAAACCPPLRSFADAGT